MTSKYLNVEDFGTSFATPEVATKLFIAKAYWRKNDKAINAGEAKTRLLLATDLNPKFIGKYAAPGRTNINKLLQLKSYLVTNNDKIVSVDSLIDGGLNLGSNSRYFGVQDYSELDSKTIRGICYINNRWFYFKDNEWMAIAYQPDHLHISISSGGVEKTILTAEFKRNYKEFIYIPKL